MCILNVQQEHRALTRGLGHGSCNCQSNVNHYHNVQDILNLYRSIYSRTPPCGHPTYVDTRTPHYYGQARRLFPSNLLYGEKVVPNRSIFNSFKVCVQS